MKKTATALLLILITNIALLQNSWSQVDPGSHRVSPGKSQIAIKSELVRPVVRLPPKPKLLRSNPYRFTAIRLGEADPWAVPDDEDITLDRPRMTVVKQRVWDPDLDISDYAKGRLAIARALALAKHREKWS